MVDFQVFYDPDGCFLVTEQAVLCGQCRGAHYLFRNVGGKTLCLECAGSIVDNLALLKAAIAAGYSPQPKRTEASSGR